MNKFYFILLIFISLSISSCATGQSNEKLTNSTVQVEETDTFPIQSRLNNKIKVMKPYLRKNPSYNQRYAIFIDMKQHSGKYRFFVYDFDSSKVVSQSLVAHGSGSETGYKDSLKFSNTPNSYCTSLGKYKIGKSYIGSFGKSYKLHGLEATNNKALERSVVLHRYSCVPEDEQDYEICNSLGCPMVSESYFLILDKYISSSLKPIIMEIYY